MLITIWRKSRLFLVARKAMCGTRVNWKNCFFCYVRHIAIWNKLIITIITHEAICVLINHFAVSFRGLISNLTADRNLFNMSGIEIVLVLENYRFLNRIYPLKTFEPKPNRNFLFFFLHRKWNRKRYLEISHVFFFRFY